MFPINSFEMDIVKIVHLHFRLRTVEQIAMGSSNIISLQLEITVLIKYNKTLIGLSLNLSLSSIIRFFSADASSKTI